MLVFYFNNLKDYLRVTPRKNTAVGVRYAKIKTDK